ncbi:hypothetical protein H6758_02935 [Candidatus Nomurabacteria bacterium]|nr:hypothetical protein [Candidatus Nomurabacteria bacterium]
MKAQKKHKFYFVLTLVIMVIFLLPEASHALSRAVGQTSAVAGSQGANFGEAADPRVVVAKVIKNILGIMGIAMVGFYVYAGVLWTSAGGSQDQVDKAKKIIRYNVIGTIIIFMAYSITYFISTSFSRATVDKPEGQWQIDIGEDQDRFDRPNVYRTPSNEAYYNTN